MSVYKFYLGFKGSIDLYFNILCSFVSNALSLFLLVSNIGVRERVTIKFEILEREETIT